MTPRRPPRLDRRGTSVALGFLVLLGACTSSKTAAPQATATAPTTPAPAGATNAGSCTTGGTTALGQGSGDVLVPGDIPDSQKYMKFSSSGYHISVPDSWGRSPSGNGVTFSDKFNSISVEVTAAATAPTVASAQSSEVAALASSLPCFEPGKVTSVTRTAGAAVLITYRADSATNAVTGKVVHQDVERYEFWRAGQQGTITLSAPKGSDNVDPWRKVTDSFAWGP